MKKFKLKKIDAFTHGLSRGNPAAGIYLHGINDISDDEMLAIAKELKGFVNEVVYLFSDDDGLFFKYYSSECEVDFCGHGTIAVMFDLISNSRELQDEKIINIKVKNELLKVYNHIIEDGSIFITAPSPSYLNNTIGNQKIAGALNVTTDEIDSNANIGFINAGLNTLIVPIINLNRCCAINPDQEQLRHFCLNNDVDIVLVYTEDVSRTGNNYRTRVFAPRFGYLEDPATGSGNSAFGYYLLNNNAWDGQLLFIEQNNSIELPNMVKLRTMSYNDRTYVLFGGSAIVRIDGTYSLH